MKIKGAELSLFMNEAWPYPDAYWDHELFGENPDPEAIYDTSLIEGIFWGGAWADKPFEGPNLEIDPLIEAWRVSRSYTPFLLRLPRPDADPASLTPPDGASVAAAAQLLLASEKALDELSRLLAGNRMMPPGLLVRAALTTLAEQDAGLRVHLPLRPVMNPVETNLNPEPEI